MAKVDIFSGFLGAGKTTLIKKLIQEAYKGEKTVLIENEFGEIGVDGKFLEDAGVEITEMNSGCICCSLVGDFGEALKKVIADFNPDRILIEPSGVGKLSDVIRAVRNVGSDSLELNSFTTVVDAGKCRIYMKNFGEFFNDQVEHAQTIILSHTGLVSEEKTAQAVAMLREHNKDAVIVTTDWAQLTGAQILEAMEKKNITLEDELKKLSEEEEEDECPICGHHHHGHDHHHEHEHEHHHDQEHEHDHHHDHDHEHEHHHEHEHEHEHHHYHDHEHHHHHHHADDVFTSWGKETAVKYTEEEMKNILDSLQNEEKYGMILRSKGVVAGADGKWIHFDYVPGEPDVRTGSADITGKICVIGSKINEDALSELFRLK
ncbi:MAG: GTP-binding protein [Clostridia bacterium]|nr:GTP-binding protein [Clostridia bacterium]